MARGVAVQKVSIVMEAKLYIRFTYPVKIGQVIIYVSLETLTENCHL